MAAERLSEDSKRFKARIAGLAYLGTIIGGLFAEVFARSRLIVSGDALATSTHIVASGSLYRSGLVADLFMLICYVIVTALFYELFKPASRSVSRIAALFSVIGIAVLSAACIALLAPLILLSGAHWVQGFLPEQLNTLAYAALRLHSQGYVVSLVFFGVYCGLIGYLILQARILPGVIGALMIFAGLCYVLNSTFNLLAIPLPGPLTDVALLPGLIAEAALGLWLAVFAVREPKARAAG